ncbi:MAG: hypothetical protein IPK03_07540 [Bacteroidetes bacterium]|nr:hypothetical protein [Bacteroidota bacterium]
MKSFFLMLNLLLAASAFAGGFEYNAKTGLVTEKKTKLFVFKSMPDYQNDGSYIYNLFSIGGMQVCSFFVRTYSDTTLVGDSYGRLTNYYKVVFYDEAQTTIELEFTEDKLKLIDLIKQAKLLKGEEIDEAAKLAFVKKYAHSITGR